MDAAVITSAEHIDAEWLTRALRANGALSAGSVAAIDAEVVGGTWSRMVRLRPRYDGDAAGERPSSLILKICTADHGVFGPSEVHYYTRDYAGAAVPLPRCYQAVYRDHPSAYHLLLEDLSATHANSWDVPPSLEHGRAIAGALAGLHAVRWGSERLAAIGMAVVGEAELARYFAHVNRGLAPLLDILGDDLPPTWRDALAGAFEHHERVMRVRAQRDLGLTLVHGDPNPGNILVPRQDAHLPVYLIDRQPFQWSLQAWIGASDLAYLMVLYWEPPQRRRWQEPVLRCYQAALAERGIDLPWEQLLWDYRLAVVQCLEHAVEWLVNPEDRTAKRWLWEMQLGRAMDAFLELSCSDLWT